MVSGFKHKVRSIPAFARSALILTALLASALGASRAVPAAERAESGTSSAAIHPSSQARLPGETFAQARDRWLGRLGHGSGRHAMSEFLAAARGTAFELAVPLDDVDFSAVPAVADWATLEAGFKMVRDSRFMDMPTRPGFRRRSTWLYPDDGCFARASLMGENLTRASYARPSKLFIFGSLRVRTPNARTGSVSWWYHAVPIYRQGAETFVLDPAIDPSRPLLVREWVATMTQDPSDVTLSVCNGHSYAPESVCLTADETTDGAALRDQKGYLAAEWNRLVALGRDPEKELGDLPPWQ